MKFIGIIFVISLLMLTISANNLDIVFCLSFVAMFCSAWKLNLIINNKNK